MEYKELSYDEIIPDLVKHIEAHYEETELYSDQIPLDPNYDLYKSLNDAGVLHFYGAYDGSDLIGYLICITHHKAHCKDALYSVADMIYVAPEHRHGVVAQNLLNHWEDSMREKDVSVLCINFKNHLVPNSLMDFLEFDNVETVFTKYIK